MSPADRRWRKDGFAVFIDGIEDVVTYHQIRNEFRRFGTVVGVYLPSRRKPGRRFRFAFVRYEQERDAAAAVRCMDGAFVLQSVLRVNKARYESRSSPKKVWQTKFPTRSPKWEWRPKQGGTHEDVKVAGNTHKSVATQDVIHNLSRVKR
ncbi:uncharacterized protein LOC130742755 [Lotus japonicus]|uniref:uncharacterized protein LOC130742755 n=1 Tax=Lotus japonicus TaxID=34305 RepID=UPI00258A806C|nr:uncharacterized protein LOC130742755 [Lotus japonicus]